MLHLSSVLYAEQYEGSCERMLTFYFLCHKNMHFRAFQVWLAFTIACTQKNHACGLNVESTEFVLEFFGLKIGAYVLLGMRPKIAFPW